MPNLVQIVIDAENNASEELRDLAQDFHELEDSILPGIVDNLRLRLDEVAGSAQKAGVDIGGIKSEIQALETSIEGAEDSAQNFWEIFDKAQNIEGKISQIGDSVLDIGKSADSSAPKAMHLTHLLRGMTGEGAQLARTALSIGENFQHGFAVADAAFVASTLGLALLAKATIGFLKDSKDAAIEAGVMADEISRWDEELKELQVTIGTDLLESTQALRGPMTDILTLFNEFGVGTVLWKANLGGSDGLTELIIEYNKRQKMMNAEVETWNDIADVAALKAHDLANEYGNVAEAVQEAAEAEPIDIFAGVDFSPEGTIKSVLDKAAFFMNDELMKISADINWVNSLLQSGKLDPQAAQAYGNELFIEMQQALVAAGEQSQYQANINIRDMLGIDWSQIPAAIAEAMQDAGIPAISDLLTQEFQTPLVALTGENGLQGGLTTLDGFTFSKLNQEIETKISGKLNAAKEDAGELLAAFQELDGTRVTMYVDIVETTIAP